jgi:hypothetical protein
MQQSATADLNQIVSAFTVYKFIQAITTPFEQMDAHRLGIIDRQGNFLKSYDELTTHQEKEAASIFNRLIINIKKIFNMVPDPRVKAMLTSLPTAIFLVKEDVITLGGDGDEFEKFIYELFLEKGIDLKEEYMNRDFQEIIKEEASNTIGYVFGVPIYKYNGVCFSHFEGE